MIQAVAVTFVLTLVCLALWAIKWWVLAAVCLYAVYRVASYWSDRRMVQGRAERARMAALVKRADRQHSAMMLGDPDDGTYGDFPPDPGIKDLDEPDPNHLPHHWE
jgi:hypothetical protein